MSIPKSTPMMPYCYFRKRIVPTEQATISIAAHSLQYGTSCFAGIRGYRTDNHLTLMRLPDHHRRLMDGAKIMGFDFYLSFNEFQEIVRELVEANAPESDCYIRPFIFSEEPRISPHCTELSFDLALYMIPMSHYFDPHKGLKLMFSSWRKIPDSVISIKAKASGCYLNSSLATMEARRCGYDEALLLDQQGSVAEASVANILISYQGELFSPPQGSAVLDGITLRSAIALLQHEGIEVRREPIDRSMIYSSDELILTGTAAQIMFAQSVDGRAVGQSGGKAGSICCLLRERLGQVIAGNHPFSGEWTSRYPIPQTASNASVS